MNNKKILWKVAATVFVLALSLTIFTSCKSKNEEEPVEDTPIVSGEDPEPNEDPSLTDDSTIAMETLAMLPEIMEYFESGMSVEDLQESVDVEGQDCFLFGVGTLEEDGNVTIEYKYAVTKEGSGIYKLESEPSDWVLVR